MTPGRFQFRLERVRALRERFEDQSREDLARSLHHRLVVESELQGALERLDGARAAQRDVVATGGASGSDLMYAQAYAERMGRSRDLATEHLAQRDAEVTERRTALASAARERQTLERLKDRKRAQHGLEMLRAENAAQDEMTTARYRRPA